MHSYEFTDVFVTGKAQLAIDRPSATSRSVLLIHNLYGDKSGWLAATPYTDFMLNGVVNGSRQREPTVVAYAYNDSYARAVRTEEVYLPTSFQLSQINILTEENAKVVFPRILHVTGVRMEMHGELTGVDRLVLDQDAVVTFASTSKTYVPSLCTRYATLPC